MAFSFDAKNKIYVFGYDALIRATVLHAQTLYAPDLCVCVHIRAWFGLDTWCMNQVQMSFIQTQNTKIRVDSGSIQTQNTQNSGRLGSMLIWSNPSVLALIKEVDMSKSGIEPVIYRNWASLVTGPHEFLVWTQALLLYKLHWRKRYRVKKNIL